MYAPNHPKSGISKYLSNLRIDFHSSYKIIWLQYSSLYYLYTFINLDLLLIYFRVQSKDTKRNILRE